MNKELNEFEMYGNGIIRMTEVRASLISGAGRGVFTTRSFKKGELICFYDGYQPNSINNLTSIEKNYRYNDIIGYMVPRKSNGCAQIINDYAKPKPTREQLDDLLIGSGNDKLLKACSLIIKQYQIETEKGVNVAPTDKKLNWFEATRFIKAGEELYFSYGPAYWYQEYYKDYPILSLACEGSTNLLYNDKIQKTLVKMYNNSEYKDTEIDKVLLSFLMKLIVENKIIIEESEGSFKMIIV